MITLSITTAGIPWSDAELARISVAFVGGDDAPIEIVQRQLEALGYRVTAIQGLGMEVSAEVEVTGESITDEQIRELRQHARYAAPRTVACWSLYTDAQIALGELSPPGPRATYAEERQAARVRCAAAINARADAAFDAGMAQAALEHNLRGGKS